MKFYDITFSGNAQRCRGHRHSTDNDLISSCFMSFLVMSIFMENFTIYGSHIFCPLLFQVNQCPLSATKAKMLNSGKHQIFIF